MITSPATRVRPATPGDRHAIMRINRLSWEQAYAHIFSHDEICRLFNNTLRQHGSWVLHRDQRIATLVAECNKTPVGFIGVGTLLNDHAGEVTTFYMHPDYQGQGIGRALWDAALNVLKRQGRPAVWVWVLEKAHARHFYEAQGCIAKASGTYSVGNHKENAIGYWCEL